MAAFSWKAIILKFSTPFDSAHIGEFVGNWNMSEMEMLNFKPGVG